MTELITRPGAWLLQQAVAWPDTVVMKTVTADRGWFETVTGVASGVMTLTLLGLAIMLAPAAWSFWRTFRKARAMLDRMQGDVAPLARHAGNIADNLDYITTSIRNDVQQVNATIAAANRRLQAAMDMTEERLKEFNALLHVVQQEAEQAFVSTAAAVRGVRTGAAAFTGLARDGKDEELNGGHDDGHTDESDAVPDRRQRSREASARPRVRSRRKRPE
jgi:uncharacterized protein YoxC